MLVLCAKCANVDASSTQLPHNHRIQIPFHKDVIMCVYRSDSQCICASVVCTYVLRR